MKTDTLFYHLFQAERQNEAVSPFLSLPNLHRVFLDQLPLLDSPNPKLWLIALLLAPNPDVSAIVHEAHPEDGNDWQELLETVLVYKLPHLIREEILTMLELHDIDLKQTRFYQQAVSEGRQEGMEKGRIEGEAVLLLRLLDAQTLDEVLAAHG